MKFWLAYILIYFITANLVAQEIQWGPVNEIQRNSKIKSYISFENGFYILKTINTKKQKGIYVEKYSGSGLSMQQHAFFANPVFVNSNITFEKLVVRNNKLYWFLSNFDKLNRRHELYKIEIDSALGKASDPVQIDGYNIANSRSLPGFSIHQSSDKKSLLILRKFPFDKYANEKYNFIMYDSLMNEVWKKEIELPYPNNLFDITEKMIDLNGNIHLLATLAHEKQKGELFNRNVATTKYLLISYFPAENKLKEFEINLDGKYITAVTAGINPKGDIAVGGFYSNSNNFALAGTFFLTVSTQTKKVIALNQKPFDKQFLMEFMSEKAANKGEELTDFYFDHFILNDDGSALLIAEEYFKQTHTYFDPNNQLYYDNNTYNYNSIIVVKVDSNGEISWTRKISKRQISSTGYNEFFSYALAKGNNDLYIFFNDHSANLKRPDVNDESVFGLTQIKFSVPVLITFDENGNTTKKKFYDPGKERLILLPTVCRRLNDDYYMICRQRKNKIQFGTFKLN
jgi:hypothetical protein